MKTKRITKKSRNKAIIQHHHLLIRCEIETRLVKSDKLRIEMLLDKITNNINMEKLGGMSFYVKSPKSTQGITSLNIIKTSHIATHFWNYPDKKILHHTRSRALLQMDVYTCGSISNTDIIKSLELLDEFKPTHVDLTLLDRLNTLAIQKHLTWTRSNDGITWDSWLEQQKLDIQ